MLMSLEDLSSLVYTIEQNAHEVNKMATYPDLLAHYSRGTLKLQTPLELPEGTEVRVIVMPVEQKKRKSHKRKYRYPNRAVPWGSLKRLTGIVSLGGDAVADSEALYDGD